MKKTSIIILFFALFAFFSGNPNVLAWSTDTHRVLTEIALSNTSLHTDRGDYIKKCLGFDEGIREELKWKNHNYPVIEWLKEGADKEDTFPQDINHFYNPLKDAQDWGEAGLNDWILVTPPYLLPLLGLSPLSSILWAHLDGAEAPWDDTATVSFNDWSWATVRGYYYTALTASTEEQRQEYFARTFRGLGHQMHLLQDKAVPDHVRNSAHVIGYKNNAKDPAFENWAHKELAYIQDIAQNPHMPRVHMNRAIGPIHHALNNELVRFDVTPAVQLFDTDTYDGTNPSASLAIGLAEYANANFFSDHTIFAAENHSPGHRHYFPYPRAADTSLHTLSERETNYVEKIGGGELIDHFVKATYHTVDTKGYPVFKRTFYLDGNCYANYARLLVPRAVGYSAALLDYFFRGRMDFKDILVRRGEGAGINGIRVGVRNSTLPVADGQTVEPMAGGQLDLVCRYFDPALEQYMSRTIENVYEVYHSDDAINKDYVTIDVSWDEPIPFEARQVSFMLVYPGHLSYEYDNAVIGARVPDTVPSRIAYHVASGSWPHGQDEIFIVLPDGTDPRRISPGDSPNPWYYVPAWSRDGRRVAFEVETCESAVSGACPADDYRRRVGIRDLQGELFAIDAIVEVANAPDGFCAEEWARTMHTPSFSPDGDRLAAINQHGPFISALAVIDLAGGGPWRWINDHDFWWRKDLRNPSLQVSPPAWSPVRDEIVYQIHTEPHPVTGVMTAYRNLYRINADGSENIRLTDDPYHNAYPSWSSDGEWILFVSDRDIQGVWDIWMMDRHGANARKVYDCRPGGCLRPSFSPDNRRIAFLYEDDILALDLLSGDPPIVVVSAGNDRFNLAPLWSPALETPRAVLHSPPEPIAPGQTAILRWESEHADAAEIGQGIGEVAAAGSMVVTPTQTTTYTLTVHGLGGRATADTTVSVLIP